MPDIYNPPKLPFSLSGLQDSGPKRTIFARAHLEGIFRTEKPPGDTCVSGHEQYTMSQETHKHMRIIESKRPTPNDGTQGQCSLDSKV